MCLGEKVCTYVGVYVFAQRALCVDAGGVPFASCEGMSECSRLNIH
jgi:hypothetical protein